MRAVPELPEVEVLVRELRPHLVSRRIDEVRILRRKLIAPRTFAARLRGRRIQELRRRGKTIWVVLDDRSHWLTHLRMTGGLTFGARRRKPIDHHVLAVFTLDRGDLHFRDPRRFGRMWWTRDPAEHFARLGPEPLEREFTADGLARALARRRIPVKQALLDPSVVAGVGNIYASEACHHAGIDPRTPGHRTDAARLRRSLRAILRRAIRLGATVSKTPDEFRVYGRQGEPCDTCGTPIRRIVIGQRSTFFCGRCQRRGAT